MKLVNRVEEEQVSEMYASDIHCSMGSFVFTGWLTSASRRRGASAASMLASAVLQSKAAGAGVGAYTVCK